jgi:hypothetical protein
MIVATTLPRAGASTSPQPLRFTNRVSYFGVLNFVHFIVLDILERP